jgi:hypothetical protein
MGATQSRNTVKKRTRKPATRVASSTVDRYTPKRLAQFLLENAVDAADYAAARREVRKLGLDPDRIPHDPPSRA